MTLKDNLNTLAEKYQGKISPKLRSGDYPDVDQIVDAIVDIQEPILEDIQAKFALDPMAATASIGIAWFLIGLLYSHECGTPSEVIRLLEE